MSYIKNLRAFHPNRNRMEKFNQVHVYWSFIEKEFIGLQFFFEYWKIKCFRFGDGWQFDKSFESLMQRREEAMRVKPRNI